MGGYAFDAAKPAASASNAEADAATCAAAIGSAGARVGAAGGAFADDAFDAKAGRERSAGGIAFDPLAAGAAGGGATSAFPADSGRENNVVRGGSGTFIPPAGEPDADGAPGAPLGACELAALEPNAGDEDGACPGDADEGIAAMTTGAGLPGCWRSPAGALSAGASRDC